MTQRQEVKEGLNKLRDSANKMKNDANYQSIITNLKHQDIPPEVSKLIGGLLEANDTYHQTVHMLIDKLEQGTNELLDATELTKAAISLNNQLIKRLAENGL